MRTVISLRGLHVYGHHGLFDEERRLGQKFLFDLRCTLADVPTHGDDALHHSVGYDVLAGDIQAISAARRFQTLEALAECVARTLLERHAMLAAVEVGIAKASPPMPHALAAATVELGLARSELTGSCTNGAQAPFSHNIVDGRRGACC